ncbi:pyruvate/2-oxoglutarate dehydrogenase complex dihydrolipoamide dehydrogenase [candidate division KSB1 bacterium]|nr:pyruvate/2-oxoglutarate dehydrogenase complex dihydrolipoamide dehydrogenase [candidate division KSB1 bacterium]
MKKYDVIWIGTGQATGETVPKLAKAGKEIAILEGGPFGGSCVNFGCTPTKTLVASARDAHMVRRSSDFGVNVEDFSVDFDRVMQRQNEIRHNNSKGLEKWLTDMDKVNVYKHYGRFIDEHTVQAGNETISGESIVIHTGAKAREPEIPGLDVVDWLDNVRLLDLKERPEHLLIIGGSYIGLEFGQALSRFGCEVTILDKGSQLIFREDKDIADTAQKILQNEGVAVELNAAIREVKAVDGGVRVIYRQNEEQKSVQGSHLLVGAGRRPNTDFLNLKAIDIETDKRGHIVVNNVGQTSISHIYALGDVNGKGAFTHTSVNDGQVFWDHYSEKGSRKIDDRILIYALYMDPPLGRVGMSEKMARESDKNVLMATLPMEKVSRAIEKDETSGMIKLLVDADSEQFLGAAIFGTGGDELISTIAIFMYSKQSWKTFQQAVLPHPTVGEMLPFVLDALEPLK